MFRSPEVKRRRRLTKGVDAGDIPRHADYVVQRTERRAAVEIDRLLRLSLRVAGRHVLELWRTQAVGIVRSKSRNVQPPRRAGRPKAIHRHSGRKISSVLDVEPMTGPQHPLYWHCLASLIDFFVGICFSKPNFTNLKSQRKDGFARIAAATDARHDKESRFGAARARLPSMWAARAIGFDVTTRILRGFVVACYT